MCVSRSRPASRSCLRAGFFWRPEFGEGRRRRDSRAPTSSSRRNSKSSNKSAGASRPATRQSPNAAVSRHMISIRPRRFRAWRPRSKIGRFVPTSWATTMSPSPVQMELRHGVTDGPARRSLRSRSSKGARPWRPTKSSWTVSSQLGRQSASARGSRSWPAVHQCRWPWSGSQRANPLCAISRRSSSTTTTPYVSTITRVKPTSSH